MTDWHVGKPSVQIWSCLFCCIGCLERGADMRLRKALNNNVALVYDNADQEAVVMGRGVAFNLKSGMEIDPHLVEKRFALDQKSGREDFDSLLKRISVEDVELASDMIHIGEEILGSRCRDSILLTLSDHLGLMLERAKKGLYFGTPLEWDIRLIYPKEYQASMEIVRELRRRTGCDIPDQEAAFIALHFINASFSENGMQETLLCTKIIQNILTICQRYYGRELREDDFHVSRFVTHVRWFVRRQISGEDLNVDLTIARVVAEQCPRDYKCAQRIGEFLKKTYGWEVSEGESLYLTLHLNRISMN